MAYAVRRCAVFLLLGIMFARAARAQDQATATAASQSAVPASPPIPQDVANSRADATYGLLPGADPDNHLVKPFLKHIVSDQEQFWTYPAHLRFQDIKWIAPVAGITASLIASDSWISHQIPNKPSQLTRSLHISDYSVYSMIGIGGGSYLLGEITHNDHLSETGLLAGEAAIDSTGVAYLLKEVTQRERPNVGNGNGQFFTGGQSFPSEHSAIAWSIASVWAHEYPGTLSQILAYGLASAVTVTRVTSQQHFSSDVFIGSALGWYFGRQVYRSHHDQSLGGAAWGDLFPKDTDTGEKIRDPRNMGSPYVPLDSWIYPALERLQALGYIHSAYLGMRPWTRMECARMLAEAGDQMADSDIAETEQGGTLYEALQAEFAPESARLDGAENLDGTLESVYTRSTEISGKPLTDGYHFGQTIINDYGRPYGEGFNNVSGFTSRAVAGPFSISIQGEYQHAPAVPSDSQSTLEADAAVDGGVGILPNGTPTINRFRLLDSSIGFTFHDTQFSFGKQSLWLGPGESGALLFTNNAEPIPMFRVDSTSGFHLPLLSRFLGPARIDFSVGQLSGQHWVFNPPVTIPAGVDPQTFLVGPTVGPQPFIHENKISFKPTPNLELGFGVTAIFGGPGLPFTWREFLRSYYDHTANTATNPAKRESSFDLTYRVPGFRQWLTVYTDSLVGDEVSPIGSSRPMLNPGLYLPQLPKFHKMELRMEGFKSSPVPNVNYIDRRYRSGYTNNGILIGSWIGRDSLGGQAWAKYSFMPRSSIELGYRHQQAGKFLAGGGWLNDFSTKGEFQARQNINISGSFQYEQWMFPALSAQRQSDVTASFAVAFYPHWHLQR